MPSGQLEGTSTAAPVNLSWARSASARSACSSGYGTTVGRIGISAASASNSSPSRRVFAVTLRSCRSWKRCVCVVAARGMSVRWMPATASVPPRSSAAQRDRHEVAGRREQDGRVERLGRRVDGAADRGGAELARQAPRAGGRGS